MFCECGTGSFKYVVDEDDPEAIGCGGGGGSPKARKKHGGRANPYAELGLDRFSTVLSELETRRAKILRRVGSDTGVVSVRFVQSNGQWSPIVVKLPVPEEPLKGAPAKKKRAAIASAATPPDPASPSEKQGDTKKQAARAPARRRTPFSLGWTMRRPSCYWPAVIVLTLVSLAVFGRVFAICCTSVWWYALPTLGGRGCFDGGDDARRATMRKTSMEKKKLASPPPHARKGSSCGVLEAVSSPRSQTKGMRG